MESDLRKPGGPAGIDAVHLVEFKVPVKPSIKQEEAVQRVRDKIGASGVRCERLKISDQPVHRGALFDASGARVPFPQGEAFDRCYVALVDPEAETRWAHPA